MKFERHEISKLHSMLTRIQELAKDLDEFDQSKQEFILDMHSEGHTLQHCLRWGENALYEVLEGVDKWD